MMRIKHKWMVRFKNIMMQENLLDIDADNINQFIKEYLESDSTTSDKIKLLTRHDEWGFTREKDSEDNYVLTPLKKTFFDNIKNSLPSKSLHIADSPYISNVYVYDDIIVADYYWFDYGDKGLSEEDKAEEFAKKLYNLDLSNWVSK